MAYSLDVYFRSMGFTPPPCPSQPFGQIAGTSTHVIYKDISAPEADDEDGVGPTN